MLRRILSVIVGLIAGSVCIGGIEMLGYYLYPLPAGMKSDDMEAMKEYVPKAPFMALFFVILAYAFGALVSGFVSTKIANDGKNRYAVICGVIFLLATIFNMMMLPTPVWFWILGILVWGLVLAGYRLALNNNKI